MPRKSAGILLYRIREEPEYFLVHPGGPFWAGRETGAWTIPKGEFGPGEEPLAAALREFREETGFSPSGPFVALQPIRQKAGKLVFAWAAGGDLDAAAIRSNTMRMEWPYRSGKWITIPEVDKGGWFRLEEAMEKINPAQAALVDELAQRLADGHAVA
ncbi:MAG TPA: NUDIX domain-containing protein [Chitinophagaceae bacterium]|nr:NUDIX domain-containing protein [Chitinophagaceae bacterium]